MWDYFSSLNKVKAGGLCRENTRISLRVFIQTYLIYILYYSKKVLNLTLVYGECLDISFVIISY